MTKTRTARPPTRTIRILEYDIPVLEHVTAGEAIELEELASKQIGNTSTSSTKQNLEILSILVRYRLGETLDIENVMQTPIDVDALDEAITELVRPFANGFARRLLRRKRTQAQQLEPEQLKQSITELREYLAELEGIYRERVGGNAPKPS